MDPPLRKKQKTESAEIKKLSEHIIFSHILPYLSFKVLARFKSVAKSWKKLISDDSLFALDQSRQASPISLGLISGGSYGRSLVFFPTFGSPIGIPNPSLDFVPGGYCHKIFASANGLLCLQCYDFSLFFYICNAATEEGHIVVDNGKRGYDDSIGLAFDPRISTKCYKLVYALRQLPNRPGVNYGFEVFSSDTNKWVRSSQEISVTGCLGPRRKAVCVDGVVYWDCVTYLLSFDPWKDVAGYVMFPDRLRRCPQYEIGAYDGHITCTTFDGRNFQVWILSGDDKKAWEMKYVVKVDEMIEANRDVFPMFCHAMRSLLQGVSRARPLPFEGGEKLHFMLNIQNKLTGGNLEIVVMSYDLKTGNVKKMCTFNSQINHNAMDEIMFSYHNSMVWVPKLGS